MRGLVQRVEQASVVVRAVDGDGTRTGVEELTGQIGHGLCVLVGAGKADDQAAAQIAFACLTDWYRSAQARIQAGVYGTDSILDDWRVVLHASQHDYLLENSYSEGPIYTSYPASFNQDGQRLPVRIALDPKELEAHPLRIGLSTTVEVDVADGSGPVVAAAGVRSSAAARIQTLEDPATEARIQQIVAAQARIAAPRGKHGAP